MAQRLTQNLEMHPGCPGNQYVRVAQARAGIYKKYNAGLIREIIQLPP